VNEFFPLVLENNTMNSYYFFNVSEHTVHNMVLMI
jgi:hypothetical protein